MVRTPRAVRPSGVAFGVSDAGATDSSSAGAGRDVVARAALLEVAVCT